MIKALILYFLSIKPTHGYEIQKYIQLNSMNDWTKIQSGSIYYALAKLENEGLIELQREESINSKVRKIYSITDKGRVVLKEITTEEFLKPIHEIGSDKFIIYLFISGMDKGTLTDAVRVHISQLEERQRELQKWQGLKLTEQSLKVEKLSFEMMLSSIGYQIKWHEALLDELDECMLRSDEVGRLIGNIDFSEVNSIDELYDGAMGEQIARIKKELIDNPEQVEQILGKLIKELKSSK